MQSLFTIAIKNRFLDKAKPNDAPNLDKIATKMYCKPFQLSSIEDDNLVSILFDLGLDYVNKDRDETLGKYISAIQEKVNKIYGKESSYAKIWDEYRNKLKTLCDIKDKVNKGGFLDNGRWVFYDFGDSMDNC